MQKRTAGRVLFWILRADADRNSEIATALDDAVLEVLKAACHFILLIEQIEDMETKGSWRWL
ncbi:MAG: hypothetical protein OES47_11665 [Acidobacteriota bacterium]|nr:hypothetical protein [Acidobacteriota bacterium]